MSELVLCLDKMLMGCHGSQGKEIKCAQSILFLKKADLPTNPDYVPSFYPHEIAKNNSGGDSISNMNSECLAHFKRAQRRAAASKKEQIEKEREDARVYSFVQRGFYGFKYDHGGYCKPYRVLCESTSELVPLSLSCQMQATLITEVSQSSNVPAELCMCLLLS